MPFSPIRRSRAAAGAWRALGAVAAALLLSAPLPAAKPTGPVLSLPLEATGYLPVPPRYLASGASMFTLHFVDNTHLLFTYHTRVLMQRVPGEPADDDDRSVAAVLLELPTGKVLARTVWRTHDHDRYLWPLGQGRFLLRIRTRLSVIEPLVGLPAGDAFHEMAFHDPRRRIGYIWISPLADVIAIQTVHPPPAKLIGAAASAAALAATNPDARKPEPAPDAGDDSVHVFFYRLRSEPGANGEHFTIRQVGALRADRMIHIAATGEGYLEVAKEHAGVYGFDFQAHDGKRTQLGAYDTSCAPRAYFVSRSEFVAFGCHGSLDHQTLSEFDLRGQEPWISALSGPVLAPYIDPAPQAGRFAYSHVLTASTTSGLESVSPEQLTGQEITVYQNHDGRVLLKTQSSPVQVAGQNFDLAADGSSLATVNAGHIEVYALPQLTGKDEREVQLAAASAPPRNDGPILLNSVAVNSRQAKQTVTVDTGQSPDARVVGEPATPPSAPVIGTRRDPAAGNAADANEGNIVGDVPTTGPRKAPTLYDPEHPGPTGP